MSSGRRSQRSRFHCYAAGTNFEWCPEPLLRFSHFWDAFHKTPSDMSKADDTQPRSNFVRASV